MQLRLASAFRDAQRLSRLGVTKAIQTHQHQHVARAFRKRRDRPLQVQRRSTAAGIGHLGQTGGGLRRFPRTIAGGNLALGLQDATAKRFTLARKEFEAAIAASPDSAYAKQATAALAQLPKESK